MLKSLFSFAIGLAFGAVLLFVGVLASAAFAAPPGGPITHICTASPLSAAKFQEKIDAANEGDVVEAEGDCVGFNYVITADSLTLRGIDGGTITGDGLAPAITIAGAHKVTIEGWAVIDGGAARGIRVLAGGSAVVRDILLITGRQGFVVTEASFVEMINSKFVDATDNGFVASLNISARSCGDEKAASLNPNYRCRSGRTAARTTAFSHTWKFGRCLAADRPNQARFISQIQPETPSFPFLMPF